VALTTAGLATLGTWISRVNARAAPAWAGVTGRLGLAAAVVLGCALTIAELPHVLGMA
jgi:hypothetical protein